MALVVALLLPGVGAQADDRIAIAVHHAYGTSARFTLEGRAAEERDLSLPEGDDGWFRNLRRSLRSLRVEEQKNLPLVVSFQGRRWTLRSDGEGYFDLSDATPPGTRPGWNAVRVATEDGTAAVEAACLIVPDGETLGIISDFDDTVVVSEVSDRSRLLSNSLLRNYLQRTPVEGMAALYRGILARNAQPEAAPVVYLTASPRQLLPGIRAFLERNGFPRGPVVAKKVSDGDGGDPLLDQERYKRERIEGILADLPATRFVLVGDDAERDPEVYRAVRAGHPSRIEAVYIRRVTSDAGRPASPDQPEPPVDSVR